MPDLVYAGNGALESVTYPASHVPASGNNGRITGTKDLQFLEEIDYTYDSLNRLVNASKTGGGWGEEYAYDGFGNLTTKGASSWLVDTATNRLHSSTGATYDANGNLTGLSGGVSFAHDTAGASGVPFDVGPSGGPFWGRALLSHS